MTEKENEIRERYSYAADRVAQLDDDDMDSPASRAAYTELSEARQAMIDAGLLDITRRQARRFGRN